MAKTEMFSGTGQAESLGQMMNVSVVLEVNGGDH